MTGSPRKRMKRISAMGRGRPLAERPEQGGFNPFGDRDPMARMRKYRSLPEGAPNGSNRPEARFQARPNERAESGRSRYGQESPRAAIPNLNPNAAKTIWRNSIQTLCFVALDQRLQRLQGVSEVRQRSMIFHRLGV